MIGMLCHWNVLITQAILVWIFFVKFCFQVNKQSWTDRVRHLYVKTVAFAVWTWKLELISVSVQSTTRGSFVEHVSYQVKKTFTGRLMYAADFVKTLQSRLLRVIPSMRFKSWHGGKMHAPVKRMFLYDLCNESRLRLQLYTNLGLLHAKHEGLKENCTPKSHALIWKIFSVESNGEGPRSKFERKDGQTDGQKWPKNLWWRRRAAGMSHWCQASAVRGCVPILINPRSTVTGVWLTEWAHLAGSALWYTDIWQFFFFFLVVSWVLFDKTCRVSIIKQKTVTGQSTECDTRYMVQRKKLDVILRFLVDRYRRTKPPKPDASQFVVPARLPKPVIGSGGLSSSRFDDDVPEVNCTWTASFSWRVKEAALWFESYGSKNLTGGTTRSSQSTSTDWLTRTHHWSSPRSKLAYKKPTSTRKLRKFPVTSCQGSKHRNRTASRWWARWRSQSSSC